MRPAHTSGPWTTVSDDAGTWINGADGTHIAVLYPEAINPNARADLALMLAAPELLAAAKAVLAGLNARIDAAPSTAKPVFHGIVDLHAAIGKAEAA